jgi:signal transduction histidine kinase
LIFQNQEKQNRADELIIANKELAYQNEEKQKRADELIIANKELAFQNSEKQRKADELIVANNELIFQNKELAYQNNEKQKRADELVIANKELAFQNIEKQKRATELSEAYEELKKTADYLRNYFKGLEEMMFITSHKVRQPIAHILGISNLLDTSNNYTPDELNKIVGYIKKSATSLDSFTRELTQFMTDIRDKVD